MSNSQTKTELERIEQESTKQELPEQAQVFTVSKKFSKLHNLPDPKNPPLGYEPNKGYDNVFPFVKLPFLHPAAPEDNISFGFGSAGFLDEKNKKHPLNALYFGDNLQILRSLPSSSIDLIYIDPPFFSGRVYNQVWGDNNEVRTFNDIWDGGLPTYLIWLNARLWEMKRVLKETGSIYVHLDWHASHYVKCEMDKIFGYKNFLNEIIWCYKRWTAVSKKFQKL
ncbi:MAG: DNA methyltransferase, partial [Patescibacteria group bacterium]